MSRLQAWVLVVAVALSGCGDDPPPSLGRAYGARQLETNGTGPSANETSSSMMTPARVRRSPSVGTSPFGGGGGSPSSSGAPGEEAPGEDADQARTRSATAAREALRRAIGVPTSCLSGVEAADNETIRIGVQAMLDTTGRITRATVASRSLDREAQECVRDHVLARRVSPGTVPRPSNIGVTIEIRRTAPEPVAEMAPEQPPPPPNGGLPAGARPIDSRAGVAIGGAPSARMIDAVMGAPISNGTMGTPIRASMGVSIMGPSGTAIRQ